MPVREDITERANSRLGTVLKGKWRLDAVIGIGGMASVYSATHRNQARVAIKMLHPEVAVDAEVTSRFLREGYVANAVGHPGTVTVLDDDVTEDNAPFLVMELLVGQTLDTMLAFQPDGLMAREVVPLLDQLLDVLAAAHEKGIVHRDLKPENLFLTSDGRLKVLDFGIARLREFSAQTATSTRAGSVLGTPAFMAPEQALGRWQEVDGRTDIWAVGATAFTLLSGHFVHEASTIQEQLVFSATRPAPPLRSMTPSVPDEIAQVIDRSLAFHREQRFVDARTMRGALRQASAIAFGEVFAPLSMPGAASQPGVSSARVSTPAELHGATLIAPFEVTSAITGRAETGTTGQPVTRAATDASARRQPLRWFVPLLACGVLAALALLFVRGRHANVETGPASQPSAVIHAAERPVTTPQAPVTTSPSVAPVVLSPAPTHSGPASSPHPQHTASHALVAEKPVHALPPPLPPPPANADNPFDRRH